jgi:hypothetical protein
MLDLAAKDFKTIYQYVQDLKENMIIVNEQERNLSREIETIKMKGNSGMEKCNTEIKRICEWAGTGMELGN